MNFPRPFFKRLMMILPLTLFAFSLSGTIQAAGEVDTAFAPALGRTGGGSPVSARQPDGKILIGGTFEVFDNKVSPAVIRLNVDGTPDLSFQTNIESSLDTQTAIWDIEVQPDGKILIVGTFTRIGGVSRNRVARLNSDGSLDMGFDPGSGADDWVMAVAVQPDGKVVIGGMFSVFNGVNRSRIARMNPDGTFDPFFEPGTGIQGSGSIGIGVETIFAQADGKIIIGGTFQTVNGFSRNGLARLNYDGTVDTGFAPLPGATGVIPTVTSIVQQADGKFVIGGSFSSFNGVTRPGVTRLLANGLTDSAFLPTTGGDINTVKVQSDGKVLATRLSQNILRFNTDGSVDAGFNPGISIGSAGEIISIEPNGEILTIASVLQTKPYRLVRLNANGAVNDTKDYFAGTGGTILCILVQPDGKIMMSGLFDFAGGLERHKVARFNADGTVDTSFNASSIDAGTLRALVRQPDGKYLIGGAGISINGGGSYGLLRLNADGSVDNSFAPGTIYSDVESGRERINTIALAADGKIYIGGFFTGYNAPINRLCLARINPNGTLDASFNKMVSVSAPPNVAESKVHQIMIQPDGKILVSGEIYFGNHGDFRSSLERFNPNNTVDAGFNPAVFNVPGPPYGFLDGFDLHSDGKINLGYKRLNPDGTHDPTYAYPDVSGGAIRSVKIQPNGKVIMGGDFHTVSGQARKRLARVNANGMLDTSFAPQVSEGSEDYLHWVDTLALQSDGKILVGGGFSKINNLSRYGVARLNAEPRAPFDFDGDGRTDLSVFRPSSGYWYMTDSSTNAFRAVSFGTGGDLIVPADYDGDGRVDVAVFRPSTSYWYILNSFDGSFRATQFGQSGDIPATGDYDADGKADICVFRPSAGTFYLLYSSNGSFHFQQWGASGDVPVMGDYDADGKTDFGIYRSSTSVFYVLKSSDGTVIGQQWGSAGDKPLAADFDGDRKTDIAVYRPTTGGWYYLQSSDNGFRGVGWGTSGDIPAGGDYDGDGKWDVAVFRPSTGTFYILQSTNNSLRAEQFGANGDAPVPAAYVP